MLEKQPEHHSFEVEHEQPSNGVLVMWGLIIAAVFFGSALVVSQLFRFTTEQIVSDKVLSVPNPALDKLRAEETERLTTYGYVNPEKTAVRIPVERAMQLMLEEGGRK